LQRTLQLRIALKSLEIDRDNQRMKFSPLSVDFSSPSFEPLHAFKKSYTREQQMWVLTLEPEA